MIKGKMHELRRDEICELWLDVSIRVRGVSIDEVSFRDGGCGSAILVLGEAYPDPFDSF